MSKFTLARLLREELHNLTVLAQSLEDESKLCFPCEYNCEKCFGEVIANLKRLKRISKGVYCDNTERKLFPQIA
jgi:hypothetical protein